MTCRGGLARGIWEVVTAQLKAPFPYFGGKRRCAHLVWGAIGYDVPNYIEPAVGSAAVLLARPRGAGKIETINDLDCYVANFWRAVQHDPEAVAEHADWPVNEADMHARGAHLMAYRADFAPRIHGEPELFDVKVAGWWAWGMSTAIGGNWLANKGQEAVPRIMPCDNGLHVQGRDLPRLCGWVSGNGLHSGLAIGHSGRGLHSPERQHLTTWFQALQARLRRVRVACGDWSRVLTGAVTGASNATKSMGMSPCGVFLDLPYSAPRAAGCYVEDSVDAAPQAQAWALEHGDDPHFRIVVAGYEGEHEFPPTWRVVAWKAQGGHGNRNRENKNRHKERLWLSPHCLKFEQRELFEVSA